MHNHLPLRLLVVAATSSFALAQTNWLLLRGPRWAHAGVTDASGRPFVFGGLHGGGSLSNEAQSWDGTLWNTHVVAVRPAPRFGHAMALDLARGTVVLFGGSLSNLATQLADDTWEWNGTTWSQRAINQPGPAARSDSAMAYDPINGGILLFGGRIGSGVGDFWHWNGAAWTSIVPPLAPGARFGHAMAMDPFRGNVVMFGGSIGFGAFADTWIWGRTGWVQSPATGPTARSGHAMCFDFARGSTLLFGGTLGATPAPNDVWAWDGTTWSNITPLGLAPPQSSATTLMFDLQRGRTVLDGGDNPILASSTWELTAAGWNPQGEPLPRSSSATTYDPARDVAIMFGGASNNSTLDDTVIWSRGTWTTATPATRPPARHSHSLVFDTARQRAVMFGGTNAQAMADTWEWDGTNWTQRFPTTSPPARAGAAAVYDEARQRTVVYGGDNLSSGPMLFDTWTWDGTNWTSAVPLFSTAPPSRRGAAFAYDRHRQLAVLFGGSTSSNTPINDTWEWNGTSWISRAVGAPLPRAGAMLIYDDARRRCVLLGGYAHYGFFSDQWEWDGNAWMQRVIANAPQGSRTAFFDRLMRRTIVFGTTQNNSPDPLVTPATGMLWTYGPVNPAEVAEFGSGCAGSAGTPRLLGDDGALPWLGDTFALAIDSVPTNTTGLLAIGFSDRTFAGAPLPLSLSSIGLTNCSLFTSIDLFTPLVASGSRATVALAVPNNGALVGLQFFAQAAVSDAVNPAGLVVSNAIAATIGAR